MIDDKEIDIAARAQVLSKHINDTSDFQLRSIEDFKDGARWAINEFLKNLWHPNTEEPDKSKSDIIPLVLITMLIYNLKNPFFGMRNLGDIRLADAKSSNGLIYLIYCQSRKEVSNENICI